MLLTMEEFCKQNFLLFPSPERIDKVYISFPMIFQFELNSYISLLFQHQQVEESMKNLETVVRERNKAYYLLETGEDGERPGVIIHTPIGRQLFDST